MINRIKNILRFVKRSAVYAASLIRFGGFKCFKVIKEEPSLKFQYFLSVCLVAKNEALYFREWIEYHRLQGIEKFYVYDNESSDNTFEVLKPYIEKGIVDYIFWPGDKSQVSSYKDCIKKHKYDSKWIAFIDIDEFIVPEERQSIVDILKGLPKSVSQFLIGWVIYGSSGHEKKPEGLVIENYKYRGVDSENYRPSRLFKPVVNPRMIIGVGFYMFPHSFLTIGDTVDENCVKQMRGERILSKNKIRINHYYCKSKEEWLSRCNNGDVFFGKKHKEEENHLETFNYRNKNDVLDFAVERFVDAVKRKLN